MRFRLESELVEMFEDHLYGFVPDDAEVGLCKREKGIKHRWYTDLMLADFDAEIDDKGLLRLTKVTGWMQRQLARTAAKSYRVETLLKTYSPNSMKRYEAHIRKLVHWGFMDEDDEGCVRTAESLLELVPSKTIAFEAKLKNWRKAVVQAENYLRFTHESWVVMPERFATHDELIAECETSNVGLAVVGKHGVSRIVEPPSVKESLPRRKMRFELLVDYARHRFTDRWFFVEP